MSRLHLLILWVLAIGAGLFFFGTKKDPAASKALTKLEIGSSLFESQLVETLDEFTIETEGESVTLKKVDEQWVVAEKANFPANLSNVTRVLNALRDGKVSQGIAASADYYDRFQLDPAAEDAAEKPSLITLKKEGEEKGQLYLGKSRQATGGNGNTAGRFVRLANDDSGVYIVQQNFGFLQTDPENWIDKNLSPLEEGVIRFEVSAPNDDTFKGWTISRESVRDDFLIEGLGEKEETMTNVTSTLKNTFSRANFIELLTKEDAEKRSENKGRREVKATDSAGSTYLITITPEKKEEEEKADDEETKEDEPIPAINYIVTIDITGGPTIPEPPAEDADTQAKAVYAERVANLSDLSAAIARMRKSFEGRHFLVNKGTIGSLLKNRGEFVQAKKEEKKPTTVTTPPIRVPSANQNTPIIPGNTPPPLITRPKEDPPKKPKAEAVTPPIQVPPTE